jgi:hypothetical protein
MNDTTKEDLLDVVEEKDGSATVDLPDDLAIRDDDDDADTGKQTAADADDVDHPDDTEAVRDARRNRRRAKKEYIKRTNEEKDQRLTLLQRQNQELMERLSVVERKTHGADLARFDKAIEDEQLRLRYASAKLREATDNADGAALAEAQELWYETKRKLEAMQNFKARSAERQNEGGAVNPRLQRLANNWMERNDWYDPSGADEDSQIAKVIDNRLVQEGFNPETEEYWQELDKRLQKRLPNRYTLSSDEPTRRSPPRSVVTGSGRESSIRGGGNTFVLEPEQVRAMKDAGMWDNLEKRNRMIKRYAQEARNKRS